MTKQADKPDSVHATAEATRVAIIPLGAPLLTRSSFLPADERGHRPASRGCLPAYLELLRVEVTVPERLATSAVRSYRTVSPLPDLPACARSHRRFAFCCPVPRVATDGR